MKTNLVVLESMWTGKAGARAPAFFPISAQNHSGARLHRILRVKARGREGNVWVTNACQTQQLTARHHGTPDAEALAENILTFPSAIDWLIVGGKVASKTFEEACRSPVFMQSEKFDRVLHIPHPAARFWSKAMEAALRSFLEDDTHRDFLGMHYVEGGWQFRLPAGKHPAMKYPFTTWYFQR